MELFRKAVLLGLGLVSLTRERAEEVVDELIKRGEVNNEEKFKLVDKLMKEAARQEEELGKRIKEALHKLVNQMGLVTREEMEEISRRLEQLEKRIP